MAIPTVTLICTHCQKSYSLKASVYKVHGGKFCSLACNGKAKIGKRVIRTKSITVRFWDKVNKSGPITRPELGPCWVWTGKQRPDGYGVIASNGKHIAIASRLSWELHYGPIPKGVFACHRCDNRICVRPDHLFLGTHQDNMDDMVQKGRARNGRGRVSADVALAVHARWVTLRSPKAVAAEFNLPVGTVKSVARRIARTIHLSTPAH